MRLALDALDLGLKQWEEPWFVLPCLPPGGDGEAVLTVG